MYSKKKTLQLIKDYAPFLIKTLGIEAKVVFHVYGWRTKKYKDLKVTSHNCETLRGLSLIASTGDAEVILYYDQLKNHRLALATLIHELIHVRLWALTGLVTLNLTQANEEEEYIVLALEKLCIKLLEGKISL